MENIKSRTRPALSIPTAMRAFLAIMVFCSWSVCTLSAQGAADQVDAKAKTHIRVLIVTGVDYGGHKWKETGPALRDLLEQDRRIEARVVEDSEVLATDMIFDYDVIFLHFKNYKPHRREEKVRENLTRFAREGGGIVLLHFACGAFRDWPEFQELAGKVWDEEMKGGYHDGRGPFTVKIVKTEHPITKGMGDFEADDELYYCLKGDREVTVLATARSKKTGKDHPMAFVFDYGKGRVFHTPLGHDVKAIELPGVAELLRRATVWAAAPGAEQQQ